MSAPNIIVGTTDKPVNILQRIPYPEREYILSGKTVFLILIPKVGRIVNGYYLTPIIRNSLPHTALRQIQSVNISERVIAQNLYFFLDI